MGKRKRSGSHCLSESEINNLQTNSADEGTKEAEIDFELESQLKSKSKSAKSSFIADVESEEVGGHQLRASARQAKKHKIEINQEDNLAGNAATETPETIGSSEVNSQDSKKQKRQWELWSTEDKEAFFEALNEHGKDFEAIQNYIATKSKKRSGASQHITLKNRDQVRHFYYRSWHKISKYLSISEDVKKSTQELYGLINYGELRRKLSGHLDKKSGGKLNELVHKGVTVIRYKGKNLRIRTPLCRTLKVLNKLNDSPIDDNWKLPSSIVAELWPKTNASWAFVQSTSQNPRLRGRFSLNTRISSVIKYLEKKWQTSRSKYLQSVVTASQGITNLPKYSEPKLHLYLKDDAKIVLLSIKATEILQSSQLSLKSHAQSLMKDKTVRLGLDGLIAVTKSDQIESKAVELGDSYNKEKEPEGNACGFKSNGFEMHSTSSVCSSQICDEQKIEIKIECESQDSHSVMHDFTLRQLKALETAANPDLNVDPDVEFVGERVIFFPKSYNSVDEDLVQKLPAPKDFSREKTKVPSNETQIKHAVSTKQVNLIQTRIPPTNDEIDEEEQKIKSGWTTTSGDSLTLGELYLMLNRPDKLVFLYEWEYSSDAIERDCFYEESALKVIASSTEPVKSQSHSPRLVLDKLVEYAKLLFDLDKKNIVTCCSTCGHIHTCGKASEKCSEGSRTSKSQKVKPKHVHQAIQTHFDDAPANQMNSKAVQTNPIASNLNGSLSAKHEKVFRVPDNIPMQSKQNAKETDALQRIQNIILPPFSKRGPKSRSKNVVVHRVMPLLPRQEPSDLGKFTLKVGIPRPSAASNVLNSSGPTYLPVTVSPVQNSGSGTISLHTMSLKPKPTLVALNTTITNKTDLISSTVKTPCDPLKSLVQKEILGNRSDSSSKVTDLLLTLDPKTPCSQPMSLSAVVQPDVICSVPEIHIPENSNSSHSLSSILDVPLNEVSLMDITLGNSNSSFTGLLNTSTTRALDMPILATPPPPLNNTQSDNHDATPPSSPSRFLRETDWFNPEIGEFSLSNLLNQFDPPRSSAEKISSNEADTHLPCIINENSVDYTSKFADMAAQIAGAKQS